VLREGRGDDLNKDLYFGLSSCACPLGDSMFIFLQQWITTVLFNLIKVYVFQLV
jgi:hypothetical protein